MRNAKRQNPKTFGKVLGFTAILYFPILLPEYTVELFDVYISSYPILLLIPFLLNIFLIPILIWRQRI